MTLVLIGISWIVGMLAVAAWQAPWWMGAAWLAAAAPLVLIRGPLKGQIGLVAACIIAALAGGWRLDAAGPGVAPSWTSKVGSEVEITGVIESEPDRNRITTGYVLRVESVDGIPAARGKVLVQLHQYDSYLPGDELRLTGELEQPPAFDTFDYRAYLEQQGIFATIFRPRVVEFEQGNASLGRTLTSWRLELDRSLQRALPEPESSLAAGIAFGRDDGLSREDLEAYNRSGLRHLVAVSGSNVSLVAALTYFLAIPLVSRRWAWIPAAFTIATYLLAAGLSGSVLRAGIMAGVFLAGAVIGRPQSGLPALAAAVIAMTAFEPALAFDAGFQLSASATAGLITLSPWLNSWLLRLTARAAWVAVPRLACQVAALTLSASVATAPIMLHTFGELSIVSPLANLIVEPVFVLAFWGSVVTALVGLVSTSAAELLAIPAYYPLAFIGWCADTFGGLHWATVAAPKSSIELTIAAYAALLPLALIAYRYRPSFAQESRRIERRRERAWRFVVVGAIGAVCLAAIPVSLSPARGPGELRIDFLDVGQGDAALITTPNGKQVLIDGGPSAIELARQLGEVMPHWDRSLDAVALTHPQEDHLGGLAGLSERYGVGQMLDSGVPNSNASYSYFREAFPSVSRVSSGHSFVIDGVLFEMLWPAAGYTNNSLNNASIVLRLTYKDTTLLFAGDAEAPALELIADLHDLRADVLKVPHHGSKTTPAWFFDEVRPALAVISVGGANIFGHPHPDTLGALTGTRVFRTDTGGRITLRINDERISVSTER